MEGKGEVTRGGNKTNSCEQQLANGVEKRDKVRGSGKGSEEVRPHTQTVDE